MILGFTGTRNGMRRLQRDKVRALVEQCAGETRGQLEVHHGDCVGADAEFHEIAVSVGAFIHVHPGFPLNSRLRARCRGNVIHPLADPLERNRIFVDSSDLVIAAPDEGTLANGRGGTWSTARAANRVGKLHAIITRDGREHAFDGVAQRFSVVSP